MKQVILAIAIAMFAGSAMATGTAQSWVANGFESVDQAGNQTVYFLPINVQGFDTKDLCDAFIAARKAMPLGTASNKQTLRHSIAAECLQVKGTVAP